LKRLLCGAFEQKKGRNPEKRKAREAEKGKTSNNEWTFTNECEGRILRATQIKGHEKKTPIAPEIMTSKKNERENQKNQKRKGRN